MHIAGVTFCGNCSSSLSDWNSDTPLKDQEKHVLFSVLFGSEISEFGTISCSTLLADRREAPPGYHYDENRRKLMYENDNWGDFLFFITILGLIFYAIVAILG